MELRARTLHLARPATLVGRAGRAARPRRGPRHRRCRQEARSGTRSSPPSRPMNAKIGETITIKGRNFIRGKNKNTVVFKRDGARAVFVKATLGTAKLIRVVVPENAAPFLKGERRRDPLPPARPLRALRQELHAAASRRASPRSEPRPAPPGDAPPARQLGLDAAPALDPGARAGSAPATRTTTCSPPRSRSARPRPVQGRHRRRRRAGRLRVPVGPRPQRRRVPGAQRTTCRTRASGRTRTRFRGRRRRLRRRRPDADESTASGSLRLRPAGAAAATTATACSTPTASSTR